MKNYEHDISDCIEMAKATITILCPSGHRRKAQMTPNGNLLQVRHQMNYIES
jgi:hypothetical protein